MTLRRATLLLAVETGGKIGIHGAIVFAIAYSLTRKQVLSLSSAGAVINVEAKGMKTKDIKDFIDAVELAKFEIRK